RLALSPQSGRRGGVRHHHAVRVDGRGAGVRGRRLRARRGAACRAGAARALRREVRALPGAAGAARLRRLTMPPRIRLARADDAAAMHAIYAPLVAETHISFEWAPPSVAEMRGRIEEGLAGGHPWLAWEDGDAMLAYAYASRHRARAAYRWSVETSIYVSEAARG